MHITRRRRGSKIYYALEESYRDEKGGPRKRYLRALASRSVQRVAWIGNLRLCLLNKRRGRCG
jgi:hypothetical protein